MYRNGERMMAWVAKIDTVEKHPDADSLDICTVGGWRCISKINEFKSGDLAVYLSIDSWVPTELASFLSKGKEPREFNGVKGERLRTVKLRGQVSQGLLLPISILDVVTDTGAYQGVWEDGWDVTERLNIQKWERPMNAQLAGQARGSFPSFLQKTDQERIQNLKKELQDWIANEYTWEVTEKLEGSSMTVYFRDGEIGVCSRNLDLKINDENKDNAFIKTAFKSGIVNSLKLLGKNLAVQGELIGPGIQGNIYGLQELEFHVFDIFDIDQFRYLNPPERSAVLAELSCQGATQEWNSVPVIYDKFMVDQSIDGILKMAEGKSVVANIANVEREGIVFKCHENQLSFKAISNAYLLGEK